MNGPTTVETWALGPEHVAALGFSNDQAAALNDVLAGKSTPRCARSTATHYPCLRRNLNDPPAVIWS
jgi:hypothetical protein